MKFLLLFRSLLLALCAAAMVAVAMVDLCVPPLDLPSVLGGMAALWLSVQCLASERRMAGGIY